MPYDARIQELATSLMREHDVSRSEAYRMIREHIDHQRRISLNQPHVLSGDIIPGERSSYARSQRKISLDNPFREHIAAETDTAKRESLKSRHLKTTSVTHDRKAHMRKKLEQAEKAGIVFSPSPGSHAAIIWGELMDPEKDWEDVINSLKGMSHFSSLDTRALRNRASTVKARFHVDEQRKRRGFKPLTARVGRLAGQKNGTSR